MMSRRGIVGTRRAGLEPIFTLSVQLEDRCTGRRSPSVPARAIRPASVRAPDRGERVAALPQAPGLPAVRFIGCSQRAAWS